MLREDEAQCAAEATRAPQWRSIATGIRQSPQAVEGSSAGRGCGMSLEEEERREPVALASVHRLRGLLRSIGTCVGRGPGAVGGSNAGRERGRTQVKDVQRELASAHRAGTRRGIDRAEDARIRFAERDKEARWSREAAQGGGAV